jgi:hypothetical protein
MGLCDVSWSRLMQLSLFGCFGLDPCNEMNAQANAHASADDHSD